MFLRRRRLTITIRSILLYRFAQFNQTDHDMMKDDG
jgi:hypothetical protein